MYLFRWTPLTRPSSCSSSSSSFWCSSRMWGGKHNRPKTHDSPQNQPISPSQPMKSFSSGSIPFQKALRQPTEEEEANTNSLKRSIWENARNSKSHKKTIYVIFFFQGTLGRCSLTAHSTPPSTTRPWQSRYLLKISHNFANKIE